MRTIILGFIFICPPFLKKYLLKWLCGAQISHKARIGWLSAVMGTQVKLGEYSEVRSLTIIRCDGEVNIGAYSIISNFNLVYGSASLIVGNHCYIGPQCLINVDEDVHIGNRSALGARCMIFTHGAFLPYIDGYWVKFAGVRIGDNVWIASGVFIHAGVEIGNNVFVNSRVVLTQNIQSGVVVEGFPAQSKMKMEKLKRRMTPKRVDDVAWQMLRHFKDVVLLRRLELEVVENKNEKFLSFQHKGFKYLISLISSDKGTPAIDNLRVYQRIIFFVNRSDWVTPSCLKNPMIYNLTTRCTNLRKDKIQRELWQFMRMYFGVIFEIQ